MANVTVLKVVEGFPATLNGSELATVECQVDTKYVRVAYLMDDLPDSAAVKTKLIADSAVLLDLAKQNSQPFPAPPYGTEKPELIPDPFQI